MSLNEMDVLLIGRELFKDARPMNEIESISINCFFKSKTRSLIVPKGIEYPGGRRKPKPKKPKK